MMSNIKHFLSSHPICLMMFNSSYKANQSINDFVQNGSRNDFQTDLSINGEYFRSRTNNQYFCVVDKNTKIGEISEFFGDFRELDKAINIINYNPEKHVILRLEFTKNKTYFVESYQAIDIRNPDVTIMNMSLEELRSITPKFENLPHTTAYKKY